MGNRLENNRDYRVSRGQGLVGFGNENKDDNKDLGCFEQCCEQ